MKYFVCSDPHGFYTIMRNALEEKGFEVGNLDHKLIICGDIFDRGNEPYEMYRFLRSLGDQFIFVRGNHEDLYIDAYYEFMECGFVYSYHHDHNGTTDTVNFFMAHDLGKEVKDWILEKSIDFFETDHYVFVHGWIPCEVTKMSGYSGFEYLPEWRDFTPGGSVWKRARWVCGMKAWHEGVVIPGKTIVCGHWHCGYGNMEYHGEDVDGKLPRARKPIILSDHPFIDDGIIALDACTVINEKVNVVVLED